MNREETLAAVVYIRAVNNRYREIAYAFSQESQDILNNTLAFIENEAGTPHAFEQLSNLPSLYQERVTRDIAELFR